MEQLVISAQTGRQSLKEGEALFCEDCGEQVGNTASPFAAQMALLYHSERKTLQRLTDIMLEKEVGPVVLHHRLVRASELKIKTI